MESMTLRRPRARSSFATTLLPLALALAPSCGSDPAASAPECSGEEVTCSSDGTELRVCASGKWQVTRCMADLQQLCEVDRCVDPWSYGSPSWSRCDADPQGTGESLADKASYYETLARELHVHPQLGWMLGVVLPCDGSDCSQPGVAEASASWQDVAQWQSGENDGLWSSLYLTAEAYRYAATGDQDALDMIALLLEGQRKRMAITGVAGLYTRQLIPPGIPGLACPDDLDRYIADVEKDDNQWVRVGDDGCVQTVDPDTMQFVSSSHCGLDEFAGWCWLDNVSQDEYSGHMLAHAAVARLVDDPAIQEKNAALLKQIGEHFMQHGLELWDWDDRRTEHGKLWPTELLSGFQAAMSLAFVKAAAYGSGDADIQRFYEACLLMRGDPDGPCIEGYGAAETPYPELVQPASIFIGCQTNFNNIAMHMLSLHALLLLEQEPELRATYQQALSEDMFHPAGEERPLADQNNAFYDFVFAADKALGPESDGPAHDAVNNGVCMLRQFPASEHLRAVTCPADSCVAVCEDRMGNPMTAYARPMAERCLGTFVWWGSPYSVGDCAEDLRNVKPPADYLLPYWMGRYYGFIDPSM